MSSKYAVGFDFDHTLGLDNKLERTVALELLASYATAQGATYDPVAAETAVDGALAAYRSGGIKVEVAIAGFLERFVSVHGAASLDAASGFRDAVLARIKEFVTPVDGARELLAQLNSAGVPVAILSNGWSPLQEEKARMIGFSGPVFVSERINVLKPAPAAFGYLIAHFERAPVDIFFVGDDPVADCGGARSAGLRSVWFDWERKDYPSDVAEPDAVIHTLLELPALLSQG
jgi:FMN phosphatase YigB (HAD superfamily)